MTTLLTEYAELYKLAYHDVSAAHDRQFGQEKQANRFAKVMNKVQDFVSPQVAGLGDEAVEGVVRNSYRKPDDLMDAIVRTKGLRGDLDEGAAAWAKRQDELAGSIAEQEQYLRKHPARQQLMKDLGYENVDEYSQWLKARNAAGAADEAAGAAGAAAQGGQAAAPAAQAAGQAAARGGQAAAPAAQAAGQAAAQGGQAAAPAAQAAGQAAAQGGQAAAKGGGNALRNTLLAGGGIGAAGLAGHAYGAGQERRKGIRNRNLAFGAGAAAGIAAPGVMKNIGSTLQGVGNLSGGGQSPGAGRPPSAPRPHAPQQGGMSGQQRMMMRQRGY